MTPLRRTFALLFLISLARCDPPPVIDCNFTKVVEMPLRVEDGLLVVPVGINRQWTHLIVDSGADRTTIDQAAAARLGLVRDLRNVRHVMGVGGPTVMNDATIDRMVIGGVHFQDVNHVTVGDFSLQTPTGLNADGLLGADILLAFDMDIDVPDGKLTLYRNRVCPVAKPPWQEPFVEITGVRATVDRLLVPFQLDDASGMAILDTGAQGNLVSTAMAQRAGLTDQAMAEDQPMKTRGIGGTAISRVHRFNLLRVGPVAEVSPVLTVQPANFGADALIGEQFLQGRRVWISFQGRQVFVSKRVTER